MVPENSYVAWALSLVVLVVVGGHSWGRQQSEVGRNRCRAGRSGASRQTCTRLWTCKVKRPSPCPPFQGQGLHLPPGGGCWGAADGAGTWLAGKAFLWSQHKLSSFLFHNLSCLPGSAFQMTATWPPFWCQAQRRQPEAGVQEERTWRDGFSSTSMLLQPDTRWEPRALTQAPGPRGLCLPWVQGGGWGLAEHPSPAGHTVEQQKETWASERPLGGESRVEETGLWEEGAKDAS